MKKTMYGERNYTLRKTNVKLLSCRFKSCPYHRAISTDGRYTAEARRSGETGSTPVLPPIHNRHKKTDTTMKNIRLKRMSLLNFKGIRQMEIDFSGHTVISGRNASGKSTIFDAFVWVLFGKNASDAKQFGIKTYDMDGNVIPRIPHEVTAVLDVDGEEITLTRSFREKWTKKRGTSEETMTGHEEHFQWNGVPLSLKEWQEKINGLCPEDIFKYITSPSYFASQKKDVQRAMLVKMAGEISDESIAASNVFFAELLNRVKGKTHEEYRRELSAKKTLIKKEMDELPARIDERRRDSVQPEDWDALEKELAVKLAALSEIEVRINDAAKRHAETDRQRIAANRRISDLRLRAQHRVSTIKAEAQKEHFDKLSQKQAAEGEIQGYTNKISAVESNIKSYTAQLDRAKAERGTLIDEYRAINAETLTFNDGDFICPTCRRPLDIDGIEAKQASMLEAWEAGKAKRINDNIAKGKAVKAEMEDLQGKIDSSLSLLGSLKEKLSGLQTSGILSYDGTAPDPSPLIDSDEELRRINAEIEEAEKSASALEARTDIGHDSSLDTEKAEAAAAADALKARLARRAAIEQNAARIAELENSLRAAAQQLASIEGEEQTLYDFTKAKMNAVTDRINSMFSLVRFRLYESQINGGERETCDILVGGVPYTDANSAARVNAGLDIIRAVSSHAGISAPIFIDEAESLNDILDTGSQQIELLVTREPLKVTNR